MNNTIESYKFEGIQINIYQDESPESPREWDNLGKMLIFGGNRFQSIDELECGYKTENFTGWDKMESQLRKDYSKAVILPIYRLEHGSVVYSTNDFNDRWDSRQVGFIIALREDILEEYSCKNITKSICYKAENCLCHEVKTYSQWANGDIYGFILTDINGEEIDMVDTCCGGFYRLVHCMKQAESTAKAIAPEWLADAPYRVANAYKKQVETAGQLIM
jgi:hypothetical protein